MKLFTVSIFALLAALFHTSAGQWPESTAWSQSTETWGTAEYPNSVRECGTNLGTLWVDTVVLIDSSHSVGLEGFADILGFVSDFFGVSGEVRVGQGQLQTRLGLILVGDNATVLANLNTFSSNAQVPNVLRSASYLNSTEYNLSDGLAKAETMIQAGGAPNRRKAIIVFSSVIQNCPDVKSLDHGSIDAVADPCRQLGNFKTNGWDVVSVSVKFVTSGQYPPVKLGWPCYETRNDNGLYNAIASFLPQINCYCKNPTTQFIIAQCNKTAECVHLEDVPVGFSGAQTSCAVQKRRVANIFSSAKNNFLRDLAIAAGSADKQYIPFWAGFQGYNPNYYWDSGEYLQPGDFQSWDTGYPIHVTGGDCGVVNRRGFQPVWQISDCRASQRTLNYFCQENACDTDNYCA